MQGIAIPGVFRHWLGAGITTYDLIPLRLSVSFARATNDEALVEAKPLPLQFLHQFVGSVAFLLALAIPALSKRMVDRLKVFLLCWRRVSRGRKGGRCQYQQGRRDNKGFHLINFGLQFEM